jgi:MoaA/NifB/PqqE/SkfB family radical SAM enzyme
MGMIGFFKGLLAGRIAADARPYQQLKRVNAALVAIRKVTRDLSIPVMPKTVVLTNTQMCNLKCPYCGSHGSAEVKTLHNDKSRNMELSFMEKLAGEALPHAENVWLSLIGEPLMTAVETLEAYVRQCRKYGARMTISTNGALLSEDKMIFLLPVLAEIHFSLDGASAPIFEACRLGARFDKVIRNIKIMMEAIQLLSGDLQVDSRIVFTLCGSNVRDFPRMVELARYLGIKRIQVNFVYINMDHQDALRGDAMTRHQSTYDRMREQALDLADRFGIVVVCPPPFGGTALPGDARSREPLMADLPESYFRTRPDVEAELGFDAAEIQSRAKAIAAAVRQRRSVEKERSVWEIRREAALTRKWEKVLEQAFAKHKAGMETFFAQGTSMQECWYLDSYLDVRNDGDFRLCCNGPTMGDVAANAGFRERIAMGDDVGSVNLRGQPVAEAFQGRFCTSFVRSFDQGTNPSCTHCGARTLRDSGYFREALDSSGLIRFQGTDLRLALTSNDPPEAGP